MVGLSKDHQHNHNHNQNNHHQNQNNNMGGGRPPPPPPLSGLSIRMAPPPGMQFGGGSGANSGFSSPQGGIDQLSAAAMAALGGGGFPLSPSSLSPSPSPSPSPLMTMMMLAAATAAAQGGSGLPLPPPPPPPLSASLSDADRDSLIGWLRGEFAAANAIIDALCLHLRAIGAPGEYDAALASIFHRRLNWPLILNIPHPQPYFPITEITQALHQVTSAKKKLPKLPPSTQDQPPPNRPQTAFPPGFSVSAATSNNNNNPTASPNKPQQQQQQQQQQSPISWPRYGSPQQQLEDFMRHASSDPLMLADLHQPKQRTEVDPGNGHCTTSSISKIKDLGRDGDSNLVCKFPLKEQQTIGPDMIKAAEGMSSTRLIEGKMPNIAETLELRENIFNSHETAHLVHAIDELALGRLEIINDEILEPIPIFLQMAVDRLIRLQILSAHKRPDCCIINILNKGAFMLHCAKIHEAEQPLCIVSLQSDCVIVFGNGNSKENHFGDFDNSHKVSLPVGSVLLLQGKSASMERCVSASPTRRSVIVTFAKASRRPDNFWGVRPSSEEVLMLSRGASMNAAGGLQYESNLKPVPPPSLSGILPMPSTMLSLQLPMAGLQPMFPSPVGVGGQGSPYSPVMTQGWPPMPRPLLPPSPSTGTGVFFPSSSPPNGSGKPHSSGNPLRAHASHRIEPLPPHIESFSQQSLSPTNKDTLNTDTPQIPVDVATADLSNANATQR